MKSLISIKQISKDVLLSLFKRSQEIQKLGFSQKLKNKMIAVLFFEPSTRTKMSFEAAIIKSGGQFLSLSSEVSSLKKGESLEDTIRMASSYADLIIMRHPEEFASLQAQKVSTCPIINAGDGSNEHPTQTILDLFTIYQHFGSLDNFTITLGGDLKYSRTIHSLVYALKEFTSAKILLASPKELSLPSDLKELISDRIILETEHLNEGLKTDYFYMTRVQKERLPQNININFENDWILSYERCQNQAYSHTKILHPLPRVNEISTDLDDSPFQLYFKQAQNGLYTRAALLEFILGNHS